MQNVRQTIRRIFFFDIYQAKRKGINSANAYTLKNIR